MSLTNLRNQFIRRLSLLGCWLRCSKGLAAYLPSSYCCLSAFIIGCSTPLLQAELFNWFVLFGLTLCAGVLVFYWRITAPLFAFAIGLMYASHHFQADINASFPAEFERKEIYVEGSVHGLVQRYQNDLRFRFHVDNVPSNQPELDVLRHRSIQLSCYRCRLNVSSGQKWGFTVRLKRPHGYASLGAFDYEKYLFRHRLIAKGYIRTKAHQEKLDEGAANINRWRSSVKNRTQALLDTPVNSAGSGIVSALTIGDKSGFSQGQREVFQASGVSHLMAISGLHIGLVFVAVMYLTRIALSPLAFLFERCPRQVLCLFPALLAAYCYAALAGFAVSTQRAMLMLSVFTLLKLIARDASLLRVLLVSVCLLLLYDPFSILDVGFWLSCGAVLCIWIVSTPDVAKTSLLKLQPALWLGMLPMTVLFFGQVSLISPLVNLLAVPLFCTVLIPITLFALCLQEVGLLWCAQQLFVLLVSVYDWVYSVLRLLVDSSFSTVQVQALSMWQWGVCGLVAIALRFKAKLAHALWPILLLSIVVPAKANSSGSLNIALLDVGQGLSMVIQAGDSVLVYDTGARYSSGFTAAQAVLLPYLRARGIQHIDRLIISHADNDHIGGYQSLVDAMSVGEVLTSRVDKLPDAKSCKAGQSWEVSNTRFAILSPDHATPSGSNNRSCVLAIEHAGVRVLITGDIEKQVERYLLNSGVSLQADIVLVPHQGSKTSSTKAFIDAVKPKLALVAAGYLNHYGHPHKSVLERFQAAEIPVLSTVDSGTVTLEIEAGSVKVHRYRDEHRRFWHWRA